MSIRCIKAAFAYLAIGIGLGVLFAFNRSLGPVWRPLHAELNLWGWVTLLIYGVAYHILPRISGRLLRWPRVAEVQSWLAIGGIAGGGGVARRPG
ncbi:MAG: cbb3-type cytochrome c oxidase subunit I [Ardenticatenaceae bacterium]|nr:cbb3-type cytochrome c oxidase subunit I [Ardenticatenaceae bacterium]